MSLARLLIKYFSYLLCRISTAKTSSVYIYIYIHIYIEPKLQYLDRVYDSRGYFRQGQPGDKPPYFLDRLVGLYVVFVVTVCNRPNSKLI